MRRCAFILQSENIIMIKDMEKQITLTDGNAGIARKCAEVLKIAVCLMRYPQRLLRRYYSKVLEREVGAAEARCITGAQLSFFAVVLPADYPLIMRLAACAWFVATLLKAKNVK